MSDQQAIVLLVSMMVQERTVLLPQMTALPVSSMMALEQPAFQTQKIVLTHLMMVQEKTVLLTQSTA